MTSRPAPRPGRREAAVLLLCGALGACAHAKLSGLFKPADPLSAGQHFRLGAAYERLGRRDDAARQYQRVVRLDPDDPEGWLALGNVKFERGDLAGAEDDYLRVLNLSPDHVGAQNNLAMTYLAENKRLREAEMLAKAALRHTRTLRPYVLDTLAKIYAAEGKLPEAR